MSAFGIDFGNAHCRVAVTRRGGVDVLLNEISKRDNATYVSFSPTERHIGEKGLDHAIRNAKNTIHNLKRFMGMKGDSPMLVCERQRVLFEIESAEDVNVSFAVSYQNEKLNFSPPQILAMMLTQLREIVEKDSVESAQVISGNVGSMSATQASDCVVSCPAYYTIPQRRAILQSCTIAGLNCMGLLNETTAAALDYGIFKSTTFPEETVTPKAPVQSKENGDASKKESASESPAPSFPTLGHLVFFVDIGHSATTISLVSFWRSKMKVIHTVYDVDLGTREIDYLLRDHFVQEIRNKYKLDVLESAKAKTRLLHACERLKTMLSANSSAPLHLECLLNDVDVSFSENKRELLENLIEDPFLQKFTTLCERAFQGLTRLVESLGGEGLPSYSVELLGGGSRIPILKSVLEKIFNIVPSATLNATESVAKGCAIFAAMQSPKYKVRNYDIQESLPWGIQIGYYSAAIGTPATLPPNLLSSRFQDINKVLLLFKPGETYAKSLDLTFERDDSFRLCFAYEPQSAEEISHRLGPHAGYLGEVTLGKPPIATFPENAENISRTNVRVRFRYSLKYGTLEVDSAHSSSNYETEEKIIPKETVKEKENEKKPESTNSETAEDSKPEEMAAKPEEVPPPTRKVRRESKKLPLTLDAHYTTSLSPEEVLNATTGEKRMHASDQLVQETIEARNTLESYFYEVKHKIVEPSGLWHAFTSPENIQKFEQDCATSASWLESEQGEEASKKEILARLTPLQEIANAACSRYRNAEEIPYRVSCFEKEMERLAAEVRKLKPEAAGGWHTAEELEKAHQSIQDANQWVVETRGKYESSARYLTPFFTPEMMQKKVIEVEQGLRPILKKVKPPPPKPETPETKKETEKTNTESKDDMPEVTEGEEETCQAEGNVSECAKTTPSAMDMD